MQDRKLIRLEEYDYSQENLYYVTICTENKVCHFGEVKNEKMILNRAGQIVEEQWHWLKSRFDYIDLNVFVIMPNHFHGILEIKSAGKRKTKPLSELIGAFKMTSSKRLHQEGLTDFKWQKSFYERIVRDDRELFRIQEYIVNNPLKWDLERDEPDNLE